MNSGSDTWTAVSDHPGNSIFLSQSVTVQRYEHLNGVLDAFSTLRVANMRWSGGGLKGFAIDVTDSLTLDGGGRQIESVRINMFPTCTTTWSGGAISQSINEGGSFHNAGLFLDRTDANWTWLNRRTPVMFNSGTYRKEIGGSGSDHRLEARFENSGRVEVLQGNLWFSGGGISSGSFTGAAGTRLSFSDFAEQFSNAGSGTTLLLAGSKISTHGELSFPNYFGNAVTEIRGDVDAASMVVDPGDLGQVRFVAGSVNRGIVGSYTHLRGRTRFDTAHPDGVVFSSGTFSSGTIEGTDQLAFGAFRWTGGMIRGANRSALSVGNLLISGPLAKTLEQRQLRSQGNTAVSGGDLLLNDSAIFHSSADGSWVTTGSLNFVGSTAVPQSSFFNSGTFVVDASETRAVTFRDVAFHNSGTVLVNTGSLVLGGGGAHSGLFRLGELGVVEFASGTFGGQPTTHQFSPETHILASAFGRVRFNGGSIDFPGVITLGGEVEVAAGSFQLSGQIESGSGLIRSADVSLTDSGRWILKQLSVGRAGHLRFGPGRVETRLLRVLGGGRVTIDNPGVLAIGSVSLSAGTLTMANLSLHSAGSLQIFGGGQAFLNDNVAWRLDEQAVVGTSTPGALTISSTASLISRKGGSTTNSAATLGRRAGGVGTVIINGGQWDCSDGAVDVGFGSLVSSDGNGGRGFLSVLAGGTLTSRDAFLGRRNGGVGVATISGASTSRIPSRWDIATALYVAGNETAASFFNAAGTLTVEHGAVLKAGTRTIVWNAGRIFYNGGTFETGTLDLRGGGDVILSPGRDKTLKTSWIEIVPRAGSRLDLADNRAIVDYASLSPEPELRGLIAKGYSLGSWAGNGITSSTAALDAANGLSTGIGYVEAASLGGEIPLLFGGYEVDSTAVLLRYTLSGDSDLDGNVNIGDFARLGANFNSPAVWFSGDFNYDGTAGIGDFALLAANFNRSLPRPLPTAVPEASSLAAVLLGTLLWPKRMLR